MLITQGSLVRAQLDPPLGSTSGDKDPGGLAQLGEHLLCKQGVVGSIPSSSTKKQRPRGCYNCWLTSVVRGKNENIIQYKSSLKQTAFVLIDLINRLFFKNS